jgi:hypothetical protein
MRHLQVAPIYYFHPDGHLPRPVGVECEWCATKIAERQRGYVVLVRDLTGAYALQSAYHEECWSARWIDRIHLTTKVPMRAHAIYDLHHRVYASGGYRVPPVMLRQMIEGGQPGGGISRR